MLPFPMLHPLHPCPAPVARRHPSEFLLPLPLAPFLSSVIPNVVRDLLFSLPTRPEPSPSKAAGPRFSLLIHHSYQFGKTRRMAPSSIFSLSPLNFRLSTAFRKVLSLPLLQTTRNILKMQLL